MAEQKIKLTFCGGVEEVTGANFLLEISANGKNHKILVDCGLVQGSESADEKNRQPFSYKPSEIEILLVTHAHIDHIGRVPKLFHDGFRGKIISTPETRALALPMLLDAQNLMEEESRERSILPARRSLGTSGPIYDKKDVEAVMTLWHGLLYGESREIFNDVRIIPRDAGHVLGSAMYEIFVGNPNSSLPSGQVEKIVFTGDLGNSPSPLLRDTEVITGADYMIMESVYGDRNHESKEESRVELKEAILRTIKNGGVLLIPIFSLEKTQIILYEMNNMVEKGEIPAVPVYLDSPLAIKITEIYKDSSYLFNERARKIIESGDDIFRFPKLHFTPTRMESEAIAAAKSPKIIIAGSGMSTGGRITHHEKRYLSDPPNAILFVGYQAAGSLGRQIEEGVRKVNIDGESVKVQAEIFSISGYSSHKDRDGLISFMESSADTLKKVFVVMGEPKSSLFLVQRLRDYLGVDAVHPEEGEMFEL
jgi:metallo-beta-lactamase family protein